MIHFLVFCVPSLVAQMVKNLTAMQQIWIRSLGWEDPLKKGMATHSSILAWRIPRTEEPGGLQSLGSQRVRHDWVTLTHTHTHTRISWGSAVPSSCWTFLMRKGREVENEMNPALDVKKKGDPGFACKAKTVMGMPHSPKAELHGSPRCTPLFEHLSYTRHLYLL